MPYEAILVVFIVFTGLLNLLGAKLLARLGLWMLVLGEIVIFVGFVVWAYAVQARHVGVGQLISAEPFHFKSFGALTAATSIAMLSYLGFDAITTLAEEAKQPTKDIPRAIFLSLFIGSLTMFLTGYLGTLVVPDWHHFIHNNNWLGTTLFYVSQKTGGQPLVLFYTIGFVIAMGVFNIVATTGASRLLFGISRDKMVPLPFLRKISNKTHVPAYGILLIVFLQLVIGSFFKIDVITEIVNFGALFGFVMLNIAFFVHATKNQAFTRNKKIMILIPVVGALINLWILGHLGKGALFVGVIWLLVGVTLFALNKTKTKQQA
jgi:putrescine importer